MESTNRNLNKLNIFLASPRGFCAGVDRAVEIVKKKNNRKVWNSSLCAP